MWQLQKNLAILKFSFLGGLDYIWQGFILVSMQVLFQYLPGWVICLGFILFSLLFTFIVVKVCRRILPHEKLDKYKDLTAIYVNIIGVLYGIFLAFVVVAIWETNDHAKDNIKREANALGNLYRDARGLPVADKNAIQIAIKTYIHIIIDKEWESQKNFRECEESVSASYTLQNYITNFNPNTRKEEIIYLQMLSDLNEMGIARRIRASENTDEMPRIIWVILIAGAVSLIIYLGCFYIQDIWFQLWLAFGVASLIAILLFIAFDLSYPFTGSTAIPPDTFQNLLDHTIRHIDEYGVK